MRIVRFRCPSVAQKRLFNSLQARNFENILSPPGYRVGQQKIIATLFKTKM